MQPRVSVILGLICLSSCCRTRKPHIIGAPEHIHTAWRALLAACGTVVCALFLDYALTEAGYPPHVDVMLTRCLLVLW